MLSRMTVHGDVVNRCYKEKEVPCPSKFGQYWANPVNYGAGGLAASEHVDCPTALAQQELISSLITKDRDTACPGLGPHPWCPMSLSCLRLLLSVVMLIALYLQPGFPKCICSSLKAERRREERGRRGGGGKDASIRKDKAVSQISRGSPT